MQRLTGTPASDGVACGPAVLLFQHPLALRYALSDARLEREMARLERARERTRRQLADIRDRVATSGGSELAQLFEAELLMLDDRMIVPRAREIISGERVNADWAVQRAFDEVCALFSGMGDEYLQERRGDVADVVGRLKRNLLSTEGSRRDVLEDLEEGSVLIADDLWPSMAGQLDRRRVAGLIIESGSRTHHSAILARSLAIPAVVGLLGATSAVRPGQLVLIDGTSGEVLIDPPAEVVEAARDRHRSAQVVRSFVVVPASEETRTADGVPIRIEANVELATEADAARAAGARGLGLVRSEYLLGFDSVENLGEERQFRAYREIVERMAPLPVTIRTFDLDESQTIGTSSHGDEQRSTDGLSRGPLGMRALRLSLDRRDLFVVQLRALVRAARFGRLRILFPFVTSVDEVRAATAALRAVQRELTAADDRDPDIAVGAMIEVPSAALTADLLADEVDFLSIGTNDLVQYCLAVDRTDGRMAGLYQPLHPAILRVVRFVVSAARTRRRELAVCGEMAAEPGLLAILLGLGVTTVSMTPASIPGARRMIGRLALSDAKQLARKAMRQRTGHDVAALVADAMSRLDDGQPPSPDGGGQCGE
jgi:phosphoenolpyruvate-protein phosphotransferase (PTS system enzyme I)